ncbi:MAG: hypothetical protein JW991_04360 [Candidatus Pacebacteria bacterium]|nr:hypothetical protein [Candidatus Paceibacterota bacterium]
MAEIQGGRPGQGELDEARERGVKFALEVAGDVSGVAREALAELGAIATGADNPEPAGERTGGGETGTSTVSVKETS